LDRALIALPFGAGPISKISVVPPKTAVQFLNSSTQLSYGRNNDNRE